MYPVAATATVPPQADVFQFFQNQKNVKSESKNVTGWETVQLHDVADWVGGRVVQKFFPRRFVAIRRHFKEVRTPVVKRSLPGMPANDYLASSHSS